MLCHGRLVGLPSSTRLPKVIETSRSFALFKRHVFFVNESELIRKVLITHALDFDKLDFQTCLMGRGEGFLHGLGNGLLTSANAVHKEQHRIIASLFSQARDGIVRQDNGEDCARPCPLAGGWLHGGSSSGVEFMVLPCALSQQHCCPRTSGLNYRVRLMSFHASPVASVVSVVSARGEGVTRAKIALCCRPDALLRDVVEKRKGQARGCGDLIDVLLRAQAETSTSSADGYVVSDQQIMDDVMTMFMTGSENPRNALSWTMYLLGEYPEVYEQETCSAPAAEQCPSGSCPLLCANGSPHSWQEALRLYPPGYAFGRRALRDLDLGAVHLPKGCGSRD